MENDKVFKIKEIVDMQRCFFNNGNTIDIHFRISQLKKLLGTINSNEGAIMDALYKDLHKPAFESYSNEIMQVKSEICYAIKNLEKWAKPRKVMTPLELQPAKSKIYPQPFGVVLNIAPWNWAV
jgi:aldehyde dehydrogenase (NAD+)